MDQILSYDEIINLVPNHRQIHYTRSLGSGENLGSEGEGLEQIFGQVLRNIQSQHHQHRLDMKAGWGNWEYGEAGIFYLSIREVISSPNFSFPSRFWRSFNINLTLRINVHYDQRLRKINIYFWVPGDYDENIKMIEKFVANHPEFRIRKLVTFVYDGHKSTNGIEEGPIIFENIDFINNDDRQQ